MHIQSNIQNNLEKILTLTPFYDSLKTLVVLLKDVGVYPRIVGGCVRDFILGKIPYDIDLATTLTPEEVMSRAKAFGATVIPTGLKHGTVTVLINRDKFEVTTLRVDLECDGRHANVAFNKDFKLDAERRDFTINAMSYCIMEHRLYDYFGGIAHLELKQVVFIGDPHVRIKEDALRIMRFFRFSCYYAVDIDRDGYQKCIENKHLLKGLSQERITSEFNKIIISKNAKILRLMPIVLQEVGLHEINIDLFTQFVNFDVVVLQKFELEIAYALLLYKSNYNKEFIQKFLKGLKLSNNSVKNVIKILFFMERIEKNRFDGYEVEIFLKINYSKNKEIYDYIMILFLFYNVIDMNKFINLRKWVQNIPMFPIDGNDIKDLGITGSAIKTTIDYLYAEWIQKDCKLSKKELIHLSKLTKLNL